MDEVNRRAPSDRPVRPPSAISRVRHYLHSLHLENIDRLAMVDEFAMRAKIIAEYMRENQISDISQGIRGFTAFERERLRRLGLAG